MRNNPIPFLPTKLFSDTAAAPEIATDYRSKSHFRSTCWKTGQCMHFQEDTKKKKIIKPPYKINGKYVVHNHTE